MNREEQFRLLLDLRDSMNSVANSLKVIGKQLDTLTVRVEIIEDHVEHLSLPKSNNLYVEIIKMLLMIVGVLLGVKFTGVI